MTERINQAEMAWATWNDGMHRGHPDCGDNPKHESLLHMLNALVEQQRIANILKLDEMDMRGSYRPDDEIKSGLGL